MTRPSSDCPRCSNSTERADRPANVLTMLEPDHWLDPGLVLEVQGAELSVSPNHRAAVGIVGPESGLALRFPRFTGRFRSDKAPTDATTTQELLRLYHSQVRKAPTRSADATET